MILSTVLNFSRAQAQTDSNGLTDATGIIFANEALEDFHRKLVSRGVDASQLQESYASGTVNQGTYLYPSNMLFLKAIELNYSDTQPSNYKTATQVDVSNLNSGTYSFGWLRKNADPYNPNFDDRGDWYEVFPTPTSAHNVSQLIRIFYFLKPTQYATVGDTVSYPSNLDQTILGWRIAANYLYSLGNVLQGDAFMLKYDQRIADYVSTLGRGVQTPTQAQGLEISGWQF